MQPSDHDLLISLHEMAKRTSEDVKEIRSSSEIVRSRLEGLSQNDLRHDSRLTQLEAKFDESRAEQEKLRTTIDDLSRQFSTRLTQVRTILLLVTPIFTIVFSILIELAKRLLKFP